MRFLSYIATNIFATLGAIAGVLALAAVVGLTPGCKKDEPAGGPPMVPKSELTSCQKYMTYANDQLKAAGIGQRKIQKLYNASESLLRKCQSTAPAEAPPPPAGKPFGLGLQSGDYKCQLKCTPERK